MGKKTEARNTRGNASFLHRYGMTRSEWAKWKKEHTTEEIEEKRKKARGMIQWKIIKIR